MEVTFTQHGLPGVWELEMLLFTRQSLLAQYIFFRFFEEGGGKNFQNFYGTGTEEFFEETFREKVWSQEQEEKGHPGTEKSRKEVWEKRYPKAGRVLF